MGEDVVAPYLWDRGFRSLDVVVLSHAHEDHSGGLASLIAAFHPREVWTGFTPNGPEWRAVRDKAVAVGARIMPIRAPSQFAFGGTAIEVLAPAPDYVPLDEPKNNDSLVLRVTFGQRSFLLTGDVERGIEQEMAFTNELRPSDVLKVAHHGSRTAVRKSF